MTVLGFPGVADSDSITVTSGVISTFVPDPLGHVADPRFELETTARLAHGNSGGAAVSNAGQLIGVPSLEVTGEGGDLSWRLRSVTEAQALIAAAKAGAAVPQQDTWCSAPAPSGQPAPASARARRGLRGGTSVAPSTSAVFGADFSGVPKGSTSPCSSSCRTAPPSRYPPTGSRSSRPSGQRLLRDPGIRRAARARPAAVGDLSHSALRRPKPGADRDSHLGDRRDAARGAHAAGKTRAAAHEGRPGGYAMSGDSFDANGEAHEALSTAVERLRHAGARRSARPRQPGDGPAARHAARAQPAGHRGRGGRRGRTHRARRGTAPGRGDGGRACRAVARRRTGCWSRPPACGWPPSTRRRSATRSGPRPPPTVATPRVAAPTPTETVAPPQSPPVAPLPTIPPPPAKSGVVHAGRVLRRRNPRRPAARPPVHADAAAAAAPGNPPPPAQCRRRTARCHAAPGPLAAGPGVHGRPMAAADAGVDPGSMGEGRRGAARPAGAAAAERVAAARPARPGTAWPGAALAGPVQRRGKPGVAVRRRRRAAAGGEGCCSAEPRRGHRALPGHRGRRATFPFAKAKPTPTPTASPSKTSVSPTPRRSSRASSRSVVPRPRPVVADDSGAAALLAPGVKPLKVLLPTDIADASTECVDADGHPVDEPRPGAGDSMHRSRHAERSDTSATRSTAPPTSRRPGPTTTPGRSSARRRPTSCPPPIR